MESLCPWKYIEYLQSFSLRGITAKTCTYSRVHAFNYRSETWNLFTCIMVNKYYSRIQWKQQLKQVFQVLTTCNFKEQEPHVMRVHIQTKKNLCQKHLLLYQYSIHSLDLLASINQDVFCAILQLKSHHRFFPTLIFCVHVQRYQMLHSSSWESLALPSHCEPHNLQCDVKIIRALNLVVVVTGYKP